MALILFVGYLGAIVYNLRQCSRDGRINLLWLLAIGVLAQFGWEAGLLLGGIRSAGFSDFGEKLRRRPEPLSFSARIAENNRERAGGTVLRRA